jgi:WD40 repeat protein
MTFDPSGKLVVAATMDGRVIGWQVDDGRQIIDIDYMGDSNIKAINWSHNIPRISITEECDRIAVRGVDGIARVWTKDGKLLYSAKDSYVTLHPKGEIAIVGVSKDNKIYRVELATGNKILSLTGNESVFATFEFTADGSYVLGTDAFGRGVIWDWAPAKFYLR